MRFVFAIRRPPIAYRSKMTRNTHLKQLEFLREIERVLIEAKSKGGNGRKIIEVHFASGLPNGCKVLYEGK